MAGARGLVLAVSGGPDSMAMMQLAAAWRRVPLQVATVDHGLRAGSAAAARRVCECARTLGLPAAILPWTGCKPATGIQQAAREARYRLLARHANEVGASHVLTAHTRDDQAETVLMRLAAGSGLSGLAGMRPRVMLDGSVVLARPLLGVGKQALVAHCRANGLACIDDPANTDNRFARARWRALAAALGAEGLTPRRLARLAERAGRADAALASMALAAAARCRREVGPGNRAFDASALLAEPDEIVLRVLAAALTDLGDHVRPLRLRRLETLLDALRDSAAAGRRLRRTLHGCVVELAGMVVFLRPEGRRSLPPDSAGGFRSR